MANYGDLYPPLFTCDNNPNMWGKEFCGLEIKSPEVLKEISSGKSNKEIAKIVNSSEETVRRIKIGETFKDNSLSFDVFHTLGVF